MTKRDLKGLYTLYGGPFAGLLAQRHVVLSVHACVLCKQPGGCMLDWYCVRHKAACGMTDKQMLPAGGHERSAEDCARCG